MCAHAFKSHIMLMQHISRVTYIYVLVENIFDLSYLRRTELGKFQIHLSLGRVGCVFISGQRTALAVRIRRIFLHGRYLSVDDRMEEFGPVRIVAIRKRVCTIESRIWMNNRQKQTYGNKGISNLQLLYNTPQLFVRVILCRVIPTV